MRQQHLNKAKNLIIFWRGGTNATPSYRRQCEQCNWNLIKGDRNLPSWSDERQRGTKFFGENLPKLNAISSKKFDNFLAWWNKCNAKLQEARALSDKFCFAKSGDKFAKRDLAKKERGYSESTRQKVVSAILPKVSSKSNLAKRFISCVAGSIAMAQS